VEVLAHLSTKNKILSFFYSIKARKCRVHFLCLCHLIFSAGTFKMKMLKLKAQNYVKVSPISCGKVTQRKKLAPAKRNKGGKEKGFVVSTRLWLLLVVVLGPSPKGKKFPRRAKRVGSSLGRRRCSTTRTTAATLSGPFTRGVERERAREGFQGLLTFSSCKDQRNAGKERETRGNEREETTDCRVWAGLPCTYIYSFAQRGKEEKIDRAVGPLSFRRTLTKVESSLLGREKNTERVKSRFGEPDCHSSDLIFSFRLKLIRSNDPKSRSSWSILSKNLCSR
jgi:hypothetical protein